jgi:hypothetical protein
MQAEGDFDQIRRQVFDSAKRLLASRRVEQPPVTTSDIAGNIGLELPLVVKAVQSLADHHLDVKPVRDWQMAEIQGITQDL